MDKNELVYSCIRTESGIGNYYHLQIEVFYGNPGYYREEGHRLHKDESRGGLRLIWQSNGDNPTDWYAFHIDAEERSLDTLLGTAAIARRVLASSKSEYGWEAPGPEWVVQKLARSGIEQVHYDPRESAYVRLGDVQPEAFTAWKDSTNPGSCIVRVLARNEAEAKCTVAAKLAEYGLDTLQRWTDAGMPVQELNSYTFAQYREPVLASELVSFTDDGYLSRHLGAG